MSQLRKLIKPIVPSSIRKWLREAEDRQQQKRYSGKPIDHVFSDIFANNKWHSAESVSGPGSELDVTKHVRAMLPELTRKYGVRTLLDLPCGDFNWMRHVDLGDCNYIGADIVPGIVAQNQSRYGTDKRTFVHADLTRGPLPPADMILCRDCLIHLSFDHINAAMATIRRSGAKWLLTTSYPELKENTDIVTGMHRQVNMCAPPFNFPKPEFLFQERPDAKQEEWDRTKSLGLWDISLTPEIKL